MSKQRKPLPPSSAEEVIRRLPLGGSPLPTKFGPDGYRKASGQRTQAETEAVREAYLANPPSTEELKQRIVEIVRVYEVAARDRIDPALLPYHASRGIAPVELREQLAKTWPGIEWLEDRTVTIDDDPRSTDVEEIDHMVEMLVDDGVLRWATKEFQNPFEDSATVELPFLRLGRAAGPEDDGREFPAGGDGQRIVEKIVTSLMEAGERTHAEEKEEKRFRLLRGAIAELGQDAKALAITKKAGVGKQAGYKGLRELERLGEYRGFARRPRNR